MFFTIREEISNFKYDGVLEVVSEALRLTGFGGNCTANGSGGKVCSMSLRKARGRC